MAAHAVMKRSSGRRTISDRRYWVGKEYSHFPRTKSGLHPPEGSDEKRPAESGPAGELASSLAVERASIVAAMSAEQVLERYHQLIDKRPSLSVLDRFELERIQARLDADDVDAQLEARNREWDRQGTELLDSVADLIDRLRQSRW